MIIAVAGPESDEDKSVFCKELAKEMKFEFKHFALLELEQELRAQAKPDDGLELYEKILEKLIAFYDDIKPEEDVVVDYSPVDVLTTCLLASLDLGMTDVLFERDYIQQECLSRLEKKVIEVTDKEIEYTINFMGKPTPQIFDGLIQLYNYTVEGILGVHKQPSIGLPRDHEDIKSLALEVVFMIKSDQLDALDDELLDFDEGNAPVN